MSKFLQWEDYFFRNKNAVDNTVVKMKNVNVNNIFENNSIDSLF